MNNSEDADRPLIDRLVTKRTDCSLGWSLLGVAIGGIGATFVLLIAVLHLAVVWGTPAGSVASGRAVPPITVVERLLLSIIPLLFLGMSLAVCRRIGKRVLGLVRKGIRIERT